jgi:hypothetical protein
MPRLRQFELVANDLLLRRDGRGADAIENKATGYAR